MVRMVPVDELERRRVKISIQTVRQDGTPVEEEIQLSNYPIVIGRAYGYDDMYLGRREIDDVPLAIGAKDRKGIGRVDYMVARYLGGVRVIKGAYGSWSMRENDTAHKWYLIIDQVGGRVTIGYVKNDLCPVKVRVGNSEYILPPDKKLVLEKGEKVDLYPSGTYTKVGETPDGRWIVDRAGLRIKVLSDELYSETFLYKLYNYGLELKLKSY
jgi:hypothetical protein